MTGEDIADKLTKLVGNFNSRKVTVSGVKQFHRLRTPESPCFIMLQRDRVVPHIGIYLDGRILHMSESGAELQPLEVMKRYFKQIRYYR